MTEQQQLPTSPSNAVEQQQQSWYRRGSIRFGSCLGGVPIYMHYSFFAILVIMLLSSMIGHSSDPAYWGIIALVYGPILMVTIIIHELSHALVNRRLGGEVGDMVLWPLGGFVICGPVDSVAGDFKVAIAGPLSHIPQMLFWAGLFAAVEGGDFDHFDRFADLDDTSFIAVLCAQSFYLNVMIFAFNLFIPAYPLDGGRCLASGLIMCGMDVLTAAMATAVTGMFIAIALAVWGIVDFVRGNPGGIFMAAIAVWIFMSSYKLFKLTRPASGMYGTPVEHLKSHPVFGRECYQRLDREKEQRTDNKPGRNVNNV